MGTALILPRALRWQHAAVVQYETDCLVSDLRLMQQMTRTAAVYPIEDVTEHRLQYAVPRMDISESDHMYRILRRTMEGRFPVDGELLHHDYPADMVIKSNIKGSIRFGGNDGTLTPTTIYVYYTGERENGKKVILDSVGRIRVEGIHE